MSQRSNTIKAVGLYTYLSELQAPEGSQKTADNVNIDEMGVITPRRGFNDYGQELDEADQRVKQILNYKGRILRHYNGFLSYDDGNGNFTNFLGTINEVEDGFRIKSEEVNGNLYFTSSDGIKKLSASSASDFPNINPIDSGVPKAIDLSAKIIPASSGFLPPQSKVAYKVLFGYKDNNNVLILGSPTSRYIVTNTSKNINVPEQATFRFLSNETGSIYIGNYFTIDSANQGYYVWYSESGGSTENPQDEGTVGRIGIEVKITNSDTAEQVAEKTTNTLFNELINFFTVSINVDTIRLISKEKGDLLDATSGNISAVDIDVNIIQQGSVTEGVSANCEITTIIPEGVTSNYFIQVYRTDIISTSDDLTINDIDPGEECNLVYEEPITQSVGSTITITDVTPNSFRDTGTPLYNNPFSGEGLLQENNLPPISKDIELFNNYVFYSNTKTFHRSQFTFLSVDDFGDQETTILIGNNETIREYNFQGSQEVTEIVCGTVDNTQEGASSYITVYSANDERKYYIWFDKGSGIDPLIDSATSVRVDLSVSGILPGDNVGQYLELALLEFSDFDISYDSVDTVTITNVNNGVTTNANSPTSDASTDIGSGWLVSTITEGRGEDSSSNKVLWSILPSIGQAIEETARSFVRVVNQDISSPVRASYLSGENDLPGIVLLENKSLQDNPFYIGIQNIGTKGSDISGEFNPEIPFARVGDSFSGGSSNINKLVGEDVLRITYNDHGLSAGDSVYIYLANNLNPNDVPQISQEFTILNKTEVGIDPTNNFYISSNQLVETDNNPSLYFYKTDLKSDNEEKANRVYYSKLLQPEAVPLGNYFDVGSKDDPIERILALRDTLFILKTDGIYTVTGFSAPFNVRLLDGTSSIIAPDSAVVSNNLIYALSDNGISIVSESGSSIISRPIENRILDVTTESFDYRLSTFGVSYENDNSYIIWLPSSSEDEVATQAYRYNYFEKTWTRWTVSATCGLVSRNNVLYIGNGDRPFMQKERKNRNRIDFSDRNFTRQIPENSINGNIIALTSYTGVEIGDVLVQDQYVTIDVFNNLLLKLDIDPSVSRDNEKELRIQTGQNIATKLEDLNSKLITEGTISTLYTWNNFDIESLRDNYNLLIQELNSETSGTQFKTYNEVSELISYESIIVDKNTIRPDLNQIEVLIEPRFVEGDIEVYKAIPCEVQWNPLHFGDPSAQKQFSKGTIIVDQNNFTKATVSYSSDVSPEFIEIEKNGKGVGYYSSGNYGNLDLYWGGSGSDVPLMNIIPREKQRGRYLNVKFKHAVAREGVRLVGLSTIIRAISGRAFR